MIDAVITQVAVQEEDFDIAQLQAETMGGTCKEGALATFTGYVRRDNEGEEVDTLTLEHYPGMTERSIEQILQQAGTRWPLLCASVVHRVGTLSPGDRIVWVGISAAHREAAFSACEFVMDYLKTRAPFWKKERGPAGVKWVSVRDTDAARAARWSEQHTP
ncbi:molybdopterin synthase catalytic subunit MoaE [Candidatus Marimicrobium litorale]|uniref:Molybdopterin synthase catalytic subunit n=1 Tax=Candidatus Marimicrobium litorale TaxID=2518991 RepID=A0ABT3T2P8_9GAMM|nr:molybdopterin synthase catalytic subunit MoaE [Candidatus Marimicrobium litorale]MCX2976533.1 molybdopterin synthase catalytic subunit MoaE [Candidatus Marimicrobium litorale]